MPIFNKTLWLAPLFMVTSINALMAMQEGSNQRSSLEAELGEPEPQPASKIYPALVLSPSGSHLENTTMGNIQEQF